MKDSISAQPGCLAVSRAGRDKGRCLMIVRVQEPYVYVADGKLRKLERPKKKKLMHLSIKPYLSDAIGRRLEAGERVFDYEICQAIEDFGFGVKNEREKT